MIHIILIITAVLATSHQTVHAQRCPVTTTFTWPEGQSSDVWIASNCMDRAKQLIFRQCVDGEWKPGNNLFDIICQYEHLEPLSNDCPKSFESIQLQGSSPRTICIRNETLIYDFVSDKRVCIKDSIFTMDLSIKEQTQLVKTLSRRGTHYLGLFVQPARWREPSKEISKHVNYEKEDVELHDVRCGRFGMPLKFNNTVPVHCTEDKCDNLCLYLNATQEPYSQVIDSCSEYLTVKPKGTFLHKIGCPKKYFRIEFDYVDTTSLGRGSCYSIQMLPQPIPVKDIKNIDDLNSYCTVKDSGGMLLVMHKVDDFFLFRQLSDRLGLSDRNNCLFALSVANSNRIIEYSEWKSTYASQRFRFHFSWDKTMNYSRIIYPETKSYLAVKPNAQLTWADDSVSCIVCTIEQSITGYYRSRLQYNIFERTLILEVMYPQFFIKEKWSDPEFTCFSLFRDVYKANLTVFLIKDFPGMERNYLIEDVGIGEYWCSGHVAVIRSYIETSRVFAYGIWFSFRIERKCESNCSYSSVDLTSFLEFFQQKNGLFVIVLDSIVKHEQYASDTEYTFTTLLSLTLRYNLKDASVINLMNLTDYQLETFLIYEQLLHAISYKESQEMKITSIKSTEYCLHDKASSIDTIIWRVALICETISASSLCLNGAETTRTCSGDLVNGTFWDEPVNVPQCHTFVSESLLELYRNFSHSSQTSVALKSLENRLRENVKILLPMDLFLTSRILQKVSNVPSARTFDELLNILSIYSTLMQIGENFFKMSASQNSTNMLLEALDNSLFDYIQYSIIGNAKYQNSGISSIHSTFIETFVFDPLVSGVSGIALYRPRNSTSDDGFTFYSSRYIYPNQTIVDLVTDKEWIADKDLVVGSYLPADVLRVLKNITVVITLFFNGKLFQSTEELSVENKFEEKYAYVISLMILGLDDSSNLPRKITIVFKANSSICCRWISGSMNEWSCSSCNVREMFVKNFYHSAVCECSLFTHFIYLIDGNIHDTVNEHTHTIFTVVTTSFSFFGTLLVIVTAVVSKKWRSKLSTKILVHFSVAISLETFVVIAMNFDEQILTIISYNCYKNFACVVFRSLLHYSSLAMTFWMLIFSHFHFKQFIAVLNFEVSHLWFKSIIFGWVTPLLPVIISLVVDYDYSLYVPMNEDELKFCYPTGFDFYFGNVAAITLIYLIGVNFIILTAVAVSLRRVSKSSMAKVEDRAHRPLMMIRR